MKLLYLERTLAIHGGIERVVTDKLNWLVECSNCEVCLLTVYQGPHPVVFKLHPEVKYHDLDIAFHKVYNYSWIRRFCTEYKLHKLFRYRLSKEIRLFSPDIIICTRLDFICDLMRVKGRIPVVFESHSFFLAYKLDEFSWMRKIQIKIWHHAIKKVQMIVALSNGDAMEWKKLNPHVQVIPNVVHLNETDRYSNCYNKSAIFVGRFSIQKDIDGLLRIWSIVHKRHPDWWLHVYGDYGDYKINKGFSYNDKNIIIHTPTSNIFEEYIKCSMLLLTSRYEPFGLVLPEAMSCGLPVVAYDCPYGPADIITDEVDGFLIKNRNIDDYVNKVCLLIENEILRCEMGRAGIVSSQRYQASAIMPEWIKLFKLLCKK